MAQWVIGYVAGAYTSMDAILLNTPGPIRRINGGFYISDDSTGPVALTPVVTANANDEIQISDPTTVAGKRAVKLFHAGLSDIVLFLFVELELQEVGNKRTITP